MKKWWEDWQRASCSSWKLMNEMASVATLGIVHLCIYVTHSHETCRKSPEHFLRYRTINMPQINRKQRNFQQKYRFFMGETLSNYDKWYIILKLRVSAYLTSTNLKKYFQTLTAGFIRVGHIFSTWYAPVYARSAQALATTQQLRRDTIYAMMLISEKACERGKYW